MRGVVWALPAALLLCSCRSLSSSKKPIEPYGASQGAIFGSIVLRGHEFPNVIPHRAEEVFFVQVVDGKPDLDHPRATNYLGGGYFFLLNIPPGRYMPITASYYQRRVRFQAKLPLDEAKLWAVDVSPGQISFMGANTLRTEWQGFGRAFINFFKKVYAHIPPFPRPTAPVVISTPRVNRTTPIEATALRAARGILEGSQWVAAIDRRLTVIGNPPEPITTGLLFKKKKPKLGEGKAFKYIETLDWGEPKPAPGGLRWREKKDRAEIVVSYLKPGMEGFRPREKYLEEMRAAGSPEDSHTLEAVVISSRTAQVARYTTYVYPEGRLLGTAPEVFATETMLVPAAEGYYILRYRAKRDSFSEYYEEFRRFVHYIEYDVPLERPKPVSLDL
jgi:hypothetical protein